jgi:hypothetical protein
MLKNLQILFSGCSQGTLVAAHSDTARDVKIPHGANCQRRAILLAAISPEYQQLIEDTL